MSSLYTKNGRPLQVSGNNLYSRSGKYVGRIRGGKVYDPSGRYAGTIVGTGSSTDRSRALPSADPAQARHAWGRPPPTPSVQPSGETSPTFPTDR